MDYFGGLFGMVAEIWFFTNKDVSFGKKIAAIVAFVTIITLVLLFLAVIMWAEQVPLVTFGLLALLELIFVGCGIIWTIVSVKVKNENKLSK